ncbi:MAG TPA: isoprenylcysteine carboxylmethyltransferase family protein [Hymenobacter sp.]|jgi:protein-S-isoprenylcysteine O-methyltransferase Ste14
MPLREELERDGNWLFQRRSWLPLLLYPLAVSVIYSYPETTHRYISHNGWGLFCLGVSLLGLAVRALTIGYTPQGTSGRNTHGQVAESLNETGMYSLVRHPLYVGNFLMWLGLIMFLGVWWFAVLCSLVYWLYYERIMYAEEEFLRRKYGARYEAWAMSTPAFLPRLSGWKSPPLTFAPRNVLKREYNGLFALTLSFTIFSVLSHLLAYPDTKWPSLLVPTTLWRVILAAGAIIFLVLRTLKKHTRVLDIEGR